MTFTVNAFNSTKCDCRRYHTRMDGLEIWVYDCCLLEIGLDAAVVQLAVMVWNFHPPKPAQA